jgi:hypothetical protein
MGHGGPVSVAVGLCVAADVRRIRFLKPRRIFRFPFSAVFIPLRCIIFFLAAESCRGRGHELVANRE